MRRFQEGTLEHPGENIVSIYMRLSSSRLALCSLVASIAAFVIASGQPPVARAATSSLYIFSRYRKGDNDVKRSISYSQSLRSRGWRTVLALIAVVGIVTGALGVSGTPALAAGSLPCDIYASAGTPCVAAHSTVRALFSAYSGNLYQVKRWSDSATTNIGTLSAGGYANAAAQDTFCSGTTCTITVIYDQSGKGNNLTIEGPGGNG